MALALNPVPDGVGCPRCWAHPPADPLSTPAILPIEYPSTVDAWIIIALLVGIVAVGFAVTRRQRWQGGSQIDLGEVSQSWIREQRSDKSSDR
jgi:hypothetical protein